MSQQRALTCEAVVGSEGGRAEAVTALRAAVERGRRGADLRSLEYRPQ